MVEVHQLVADDWQRFRAIRLRSLLDAPDAFGSTHDQVAARPLSEWPGMIESIPTFLATSGHEDVGLVRCAPDRDRADSAWLISMWVAVAARGAGVGDLLVDRVVDFARSAGRERLWLDVADANLAAIRLYARHGFEPTGEVSRMSPRREEVTEHRRVKMLVR